MPFSVAWFKSRGVWLGIITFLLGALPIVQELLTKQDFSLIALATAATGVVKVYERVTSSGTPIAPITLH